MNPPSSTPQRGTKAYETFPVGTPRIHGGEHHTNYREIKGILRNGDKYQNTLQQRAVHGSPDQHTFGFDCGILRRPRSKSECRRRVSFEDKEHEANKNVYSNMRRPRAASSTSRMDTNGKAKNYYRENVTNQRASRPRSAGSFGTHQQQCSAYNAGDREKAPVQENIYETMDGSYPSRTRRQTTDLKAGGVIARFGMASKKNGCVTSSCKSQQHHYAVSSCQNKSVPVSLEGDFVAIDCTSELPYSAGLLQSLQEGVYAVSTLKDVDSTQTNEEYQEQQPGHSAQGRRHMEQEDVQLQHLLMLHQQQKQDLEQERRQQQQQQCKNGFKRDFGKRQTTCNWNLDAQEEEYITMAPNGHTTAQHNGEVDGGDNSNDCINLQYSDGGNTESTNHENHCYDAVR